MYRLYIDETGNADLKASQTDANHRFLSLTGIVMDIEYVRTKVHPQLEDIKVEFFGHHPDEPIVLHRKDLVQKNRPFQSLRDKDTEQRFNLSLMGFLRFANFRAITVVIDKLSHLHKYTRWHYDPYHYCLEILLERYRYFLRDQGSRGDIMAESRGSKPDRRVQRAYQSLYKNGTRFLSAAQLQQHLTSGEIKFRPKSANVSGLQIADMIAAPSALHLRHTYNNEPAPTRFSAEITKLLVRQKYLRDGWHKLNGFGIKWLP